VLDGVMEAIGLGGDENAARRLIVLRAIDKADKFPWSEIEKLLGAGRWDGKQVGEGDFTKGAGLDSDEIEQIGTFCDFQKLARRGSQFLEDVTGLSPAERKLRAEETLSEVLEFKTIDKDGRSNFYLASNQGIIGALAFHFDNPKSQDGLNELREIANLVESAGYGRDRIRIDPSVVRGLEYYTGPVYEAELLFDVTDEDGRPVRFGSVGGGGRYDGLVSRFLDEPVPATGFSIGVSRLLAALQALGKVSTTAEPGPVLVVAMDKDATAMAAYQKIVADLRGAGIRSEIYLGAAGMKAQMKYADRRGSPVAIIQGSNEREKGEAQVKDLILGATLSGIKDREEYLKQQAEAQFAVPVSGVVEAVRKVLARHR